MGITLIRKVDIRTSLQISQIYLKAICWR